MANDKNLGSCNIIHFVRSAAWCGEVVSCNPACRLCVDGVVYWLEYVTNTLD